MVENDHIHQSLLDVFQKPLSAAPFQSGARNADIIALFTHLHPVSNDLDSVIGTRAIIRAVCAIVDALGL